MDAFPEKCRRLLRHVQRWRGRRAVNSLSLFPTKELKPNLLNSGTYCVASVARLLNILSPLLADNAGEFIAKCQSYEGGLGSVPGVEVWVEHFFFVVI